MDMNVRNIAKKWLAQFGAAASVHDVEALVSQFVPDGWLRDVLVFTWDNRSLGGLENITNYLVQTLGSKDPHNFNLDERLSLGPSSFPVGANSDTGVELAFMFETSEARCRGLARLISLPDKTWKAVSVFVMVDAWKGHEEIGPESGIYEGHTIPWDDVYAKLQKKAEEDPYVLIVGAGQTGLQVAARFRQLAIPTLVIHKEAHVGDQWRARYPTLSLHTPRQHSAFLYQPFPTNWPVHTPRTKLANWMESYSINQDLTIWHRACLLALSAPVYDEAQGRWTLVIDHDGVRKTVRPAHVVLATGTLGNPYRPDIPSLSKFRGDAIHACQFKGGAPYNGQRVLIVGAGSTAADVAQDIHVNGGAEVTILQRSTTCFVSSAWSANNFSQLFPDHEETDVTDFKLAAMPWGFLEQLTQAGAGKKTDTDAELKEMLHQKGFRTNEGPRGLGRAFLVAERFRGHWIDVGCAALILQDKVKVKSGTTIDHFFEDGVVLTDGTVMTVDKVIFATGYDDIRGLWKDTFGDAIIDTAGEVWGLDHERELKGVYRPTGHPGLWYAAGDFQHSRWGSKQLGLHIQARQLGLFK